jgi:hypothetical protein
MLSMALTCNGSTSITASSLPAQLHHVINSTWTRILAMPSQADAVASSTLTKVA